MLLAEVRPRHARDIVRALRTAGELAPRTIVGIFRTLRTMFESAVVDELIEANPIKAKPGELPKQRDQDPTWRATSGSHGRRSAASSPSSRSRCPRARCWR
jgi:hypothetical protein